MSNQQEARGEAQRYGTATGGGDAGPLDLAALVEEHGDHLLRLCTLYLGEQSQAEDAVQDTFLRALQAWPKFRGESTVET